MKGDTKSLDYSSCEEDLYEKDKVRVGMDDKAEKGSIFRVRSLSVLLSSGLLPREVHHHRHHHHLLPPPHCPSRRRRCGGCSSGTDGAAATPAAVVAEAGAAAVW